MAVVNTCGNAYSYVVEDCFGNETISGEIKYFAVVNVPIGGRVYFKQL